MRETICPYCREPLPRTNGYGCDSPDNPANRFRARTNTPAYSAALSMRAAPPEQPEGGE